MQKLVLMFTCLFYFMDRVPAQTAEDAVKAVINKMFASMKKGDSKELLECFTDSAILQTVVEKDQKVSIKTEEVKEFAAMLKTFQPGDADERITFDLVKTKGPLAIAWTPYNLYFKGVFTHCGIDSYQLVRLEGYWKIQYLIDTRRKQGCKL